jgi:pyrimidine deaminase RibD-like protein
MKISDFQIHDYEKLDNILLELCEMIIDGQKKDSDYYGMVASCVLDMHNNKVYGINYPKDGKRVHGERAAIDNYHKKFGDIGEGSIVITTCSPCSEGMDERYGESCKDLIDSLGIHKVYCGYSDPSQDDSENYQHKKFHSETTKNKKIEELCKKFAATFLTNTNANN